MSYERITKEKRAEFIERLREAGIDPLDVWKARKRRKKISAIAEQVACGRKQPTEESFAYVEGFVRGLLQDGSAYEGAGDHPDRDKHCHLGYSSGMVTRRIILGKLEAMTETGTPR